MSNHRYFAGAGALLCLLFLLGSCRKEKALTATEVKLPHTVPQGDHPFDQRIVDFKEKYGKLLLYKFTEKEFKWNFDSELKLTSTEGVPDYVDAAIDTLHRLVFRFYSDDFLKQMLPYQIFLAGSIRKIKVSGSVSDTSATLEYAINSRTHVSFGYVNDKLSQLGVAQLNAMKGELHKSFWGLAIGAGTVEVPTDFKTATDYSQVYSFNFKQKGIIEYDMQTGLGTTLHSDFNTYIKYMTSFTAAELNSTIFTAANDPAGMRKKKYTYLQNYYKLRYNIDLQAIGNAKE